LKEIIEGNGQTGECDYCGSKNVKIIEPDKLFPQFQNLLGYFNADENSEHELITLIEKYFPRKIFSELLKDNCKELLTSIVYIEYESFGSLFEGKVRFTLDETSGLQSNWEKFKNEIKYVNRFHIQNVLDLNELKEQFLKPEFARCLPQGSILYRGRISDKGGYELSEMGNPPIEKARPGRANPTGISYLYVSDQPETTLYESRASLLDYVTVAEFRLKGELKVMNLRDDTSLDLIRWAELEEVEMYLFIHKLHEELSKPYRKNDQELDYLPTQYLCEFIKALGYEGVEYMSSLYKGGYNIAVFTSDKLEGVTTRVHEIKSINLIHTEVEIQIE